MLGGGFKYFLLITIWRLRIFLENWVGEKPPTFASYLVTSIPPANLNF